MPKKKKSKVCQQISESECVQTCQEREEKKAAKGCKSMSLPTNVASCDHQSIIAIKIHREKSDRRLIFNKKGLAKLIQLYTDTQQR